MALRLLLQGGDLRSRQFWFESAHPINKCLEESRSAALGAEPNSIAMMELKRSLPVQGESDYDDSAVQYYRFAVEYERSGKGDRRAFHPDLLLFIGFGAHVYLGLTITVLNLFLKGLMKYWPEGLLIELPHGTVPSRNNNLQFRHSSHACIISPTVHSWYRHAAHCHLTSASPNKDQCPYTLCLNCASLDLDCIAPKLTSLQRTFVGQFHIILYECQFTVSRCNLM